MIYTIARLNILAMLSIQIEKTERSLRLIGVVAPTARRAIQQIFNFQSSIFNSGLPGLGISVYQMSMATSWTRRWQQPLRNPPPTTRARHGRLSWCMMGRWLPNAMRRDSAKQFRCWAGRWAKVFHPESWCWSGSVTAHLATHGMMKNLFQMCWRRCRSRNNKTGTYLASLTIGILELC